MYHHNCWLFLFSLVLCVIDPVEPQYYYRSYSYYYYYRSYYYYYSYYSPSYYTYYSYTTYSASSAGAIAGGTIGGLVLSGIIIVCVYCCRSRSSAGETITTVSGTGVTTGPVGVVEAGYTVTREEGVMAYGEPPPPVLTFDQAPPPYETAAGGFGYTESKSTINLVSN